MIRLFSRSGLPCNIIRAECISLTENTDQALLLTFLEDNQIMAIKKNDYFINLQNSEEIGKLHGICVHQWTATKRTVLAREKNYFLWNIFTKSMLCYRLWYIIALSSFVLQIFF